MEWEHLYYLFLMQNLIINYILETINLRLIFFSAYNSTIFYITINNLFMCFIFRMRT